MFIDLEINEATPKRLQLSERSFLVEVDQAAIAGNIGSKDR
jgi:hypothetical protein